MKKLVILSFFLIFSVLAFGQSTTIAPDYLKVPVVTTLPPSPSNNKEGRVIFLNAAGENQLYVYDGNAWNKVSGLTPPLFLSSPTITPITGISTFASAGGTGVQGETSVNNNGGGTGVYGVSRNTTPTGHNYGVYGENLSTNFYGYGIYGKHAGTGVAIFGDALGGGTAINGAASSGIAGNFTNNSSTNYAFTATNFGTHGTAKFNSNNASTSIYSESNAGMAYYGYSLGSPLTSYFENAGTGIGLGVSATSGKALDAANTSATSPTGQFINYGTGNGLRGVATSGTAIDASNNSATNATGQFTNIGTGNVLSATATSGNAIDASNNSATNSTGRFANAGSGFGVQALTNSGSALYGFSGTGNGLYAEVNGGTAAAARIVNNNGTGNAIDANNNSATNATGQFTNAGTGNVLRATATSGIAIDASNNSATNATGRFENTGTGLAIYGHSVSSPAAIFFSSDPINGAVQVYNLGTGKGLEVTSQGLYSGVFRNTGGNTALLSQSGGNGAAGEFRASGTGIGLFAESISGEGIYAHNLSTTKPTVNILNGVGGTALQISGQISIPSTAATRAIFSHVTTASNITGSYTNLTYLGALPTDFLIVTPYFSSSLNPNPIGINYFGGVWTIYNSNGVAMPVGVGFNVLVIKQ